MKHHIVFSITSLFFATQINTIDYTKEVKREFDETVTTVVQKFEKNSYALLKQFEQCSNEHYPKSCYQKVLKDVEAEKAKNYKAIRNCVITTLGIYTLKVAAIGLASTILPTSSVEGVDKTISAAQIPVTVGLSALAVDQIALSALEYKLLEKLSI